MGEDPKKLIGPTLFERVPCMAAVIDRDFRIVAHNAELARTFGSPGADARCYTFYRGREAPCPDCPAPDVFADGDGRAFEDGGFVGRDGALSLRFDHVPVRDTSGRVAYVLQMAPLAPAAGELEELKLQLRQAERLASVGLTTAGLAHTIKNILAGLEGGIYVVDSGFRNEDTDRVSAGWEMVKKYIEQVNALVKNLLRFAKAQRPQRELVDPRELVDEVIQLFESKADLVNVAIDGRTDEGLEPVYLDRPALAACLTNLVTNAFDACVWDPADDKDHRIVIEARVRPGGGVVFDISDNGMGISAENQQRALRASFTTKGMRGTGLGLLMTRKTIEEHKGRITFSSSPGQGTAFHIDLPPLPPDEPSPGGDGVGEAGGEQPSEGSEG